MPFIIMPGFMAISSQHRHRHGHGHVTWSSLGLMSCYAACMPVASQCIYIIYIMYKSVQDGCYRRTRSAFLRARWFPCFWAATSCRSTGVVTAQSTASSGGVDSTSRPPTSSRRSAQAPYLLKKVSSGSLPQESQLCPPALALPTTRSMS